MGRWAILNGLLGVIVLLLGLQIAWTWTRTLPPVDFAARSTETLPKDGAGGGPKGERRGKRNADKMPATPAAMVVAIVNKDLFDPSRQKASEEIKVAAPKEAPPPPNVTLVGVRILGKDREAFILDAGQPQRRVRTGDQVGGYTVKTIRPTRVTLTAGSGEVVDLKLTVEKAGGAGPAVPAVPGARAPGAPRPGQPGATPPGTPAPSPAAGVQPRQPHGPGAAAAAAAAAARQHQPGGAPPAPQNPNVPQLPAGVREKLEQLKGN